MLSCDIYIDRLSLWDCEFSNALEGLQLPSQS